MKLTRRKLLIAAAAGAVGLGYTAGQGEVLAWQGVAMGADAEIRFAGIEKEKAGRLLHQVLAEVERLENIFSLYRPQSELVRLNGDGYLARPSQDMRLLLGQALDYWQHTGGAFNPALQPVWTFLARHFARSSQPPSRSELHSIATSCSPSRITQGVSGIRLERGMALSFNGIAQGYITDRAAEMLQAHGMKDVIINLGEHRALPGRRWPVGIAGSDTHVLLSNEAIAQSSGHGTVLSPDGLWHHLIDPHSGECANRYKSVTVVAGTATAADALSTALFVARQGIDAEIIRKFKPSRAIFEPPAA
jgi:thiamine biosynthesis lipoprotein